MPAIVSVSNHPAIDSDRRFFRLFPNRLYRARPYTTGEFVDDPRVAFFAADEYGRSREINTVIVKWFAGFRIRLPVATSRSLDDDRSIVEFLRSHGIDPNTMRSAAGPARDEISL